LGNISRCRRARSSFAAVIVIPQGKWTQVQAGWTQSALDSKVSGFSGRKQNEHREICKLKARRIKGSRGGGGTRSWRKRRGPFLAAPNGDWWA